MDFCNKNIPVGRNESEDNSIITHVIFEGVWLNKLVANQERCHSTAPVDKHLKLRNVTGSHALAVNGSLC